MFCSKCGKEVESAWVKCPYCEANLKNESHSDNVTNMNQYAQGIVNNKPLQKKKKMPFVIAGIVVLIIILFALLSGGGETVEPVEPVDISMYEGGYAGWEASGFEGSVKTDITIPYPLTNTDVNNYAVYIGTGGLNVGVIMQKDEAAISEWDWLMNAQPDMATQAYYFNCTLTYTGQKAGSNGFPVFVIEDVISYNQDVTSDVTDDGNMEDVNYDEIYTWILDASYVNADSPEYCEWTLYDINKDGYLELLVQSGTCNADMEYTVWTTDGTTALELGSIYGMVTLYEYKDGNGIYTDHCNMGYEQVKRVSIDNGMLVEEIVYEGQEPYGYDDEGVALEELSYLIQTSTLDEY